MKNGDEYKSVYLIGGAVVGISKFLARRASRNAKTSWIVYILIVVVATTASAASDELTWLQNTQFMAYTPSQFRVEAGRPIAASRESIVADLALLRRHVNGLITYSSSNGLDQIVDVAQAAGFHAVILGMWSPTDADEFNRTVRTARAHPHLVRAIAVGNEGLFWKRYQWPDVTRVITQLRRELPGVAMTTSEPMASYLGSPQRLDCDQQDFLLPNIHPLFETWFRPDASEQAAQFVVESSIRLRALCGKFVLVKETGAPSGPLERGMSPQAQAQLWSELLRRLRAQKNVGLALFEAFDAPWKVAEIARDSGIHDERERYWGWFDAQRHPKPVVNVLAGE